MSQLPRILLVDDSDENLLALEALLRGHGAEIVRARSGKDALELLLVHEVALALVDVQMPEMDGIELAELMRGSSRTRQVPIIFVTAGLHDSARVFQGYEAGAVDFLHKPVDPLVLRSKVNVFLQLYRQRRQLAEQLEEIQRAKAALQEADRRKDEFLGVLSHELRNPLAPIKNGLYILRRCLHEDSQMERAVDVIERQADHLAQLVNDLLDVTRIARGKVQLHRQQLDLVDAALRTGEDHQPAFAAKGVALEVRAPRAPIWIDGDATRITQVVGNLLANALKFTPSGRKVELTVEAEGRTALLQVHDQGAGISAPLLQEIFEPFTQADRTLARSQGGLGLGLALVKGMVELHGGTVRAESDGPERGARFTIRLPIAEHQDAPIGKRSSETVRSAPPLGFRPRVLVAEDNPDAAATLREALELAGSEVHVARDGPECLAAAERLTPDVVVCDIGLPGVDGFEVARRLRSIDPALLLIAVTGYALPEDRRRAMESGFAYHFAKPVRIDELSRLIATRARSPEASSAASAGPVMEICPSDASR